MGSHRDGRDKDKGWPRGLMEDGVCSALGAHWLTLSQGLGTCPQHGTGAGDAW